MGQSKISQAILYAVFVSLGGFVFGYDASVINGVNGFVAQEFALTDAQKGDVVSITTLLATLAFLTVTPLADRFGRKQVLLFLASLYCLSAVYSALAPDYTQFIIARALGGYAFGTLMLAPVYIAETAPQNNRGLMVSINQLNIVVGLSAAYFVNYYILSLSTSGAEWISSFYIDSHTWRVMLFVEIFPAALWFLLLLMVPESPRWLLMKGRESEARSILSRLGSESAIDATIADVKATLSEKKASLAVQIKGLFEKRMQFILLIGILLAVVQQATGINAVFFYATSIFEQAGAGTDAAFLQAIYVGVINVVFTVAAMALIDRLGRKPLLMIGLVGVTVSLFATSYGFSKASFTLSEKDAKEVSVLYDTPALAGLGGQTFDSDAAFKDQLRQMMGYEKLNKAEADILNRSITINATLVLAGILVFVASFAISLGPVMWVMLSEIFPNNLRAVAMAFTGFINSATSYLVLKLFPLGLSLLGTAWVFSIYGLFALVGLFFVVLYLPETKGKSLEELESDLVK